MVQLDGCGWIHSPGFSGCPLLWWEPVADTSWFPKGQIQVLRWRWAKTQPYENLGCPFPSCLLHGELRLVPRRYIWPSETKALTFQEEALEHFASNLFSDCLMKIMSDRGLYSEEDTSFLSAVPLCLYCLCGACTIERIAQETLCPGLLCCYSICLWQTRKKLC